MTPIMYVMHACTGLPRNGKIGNRGHESRDTERRAPRIALFWVSPEIKENKEIVLAAARAHGRALRYTNKLRKEIVLAAVRGHGRALRYTNKLRGDRGSCLAAVENTMYRTRRYTM